MELIWRRPDEPDIADGETYTGGNVAGHAAQSPSLPCWTQRVLEADAAEDVFNDDDDYEVDTPKRRHRGKGRVRSTLTACVRACVFLS